MFGSPIFSILFARNLQPAYSGAQNQAADPAAIGRGGRKTEAPGLYKVEFYRSAPAMKR
jgi:hypothetical protein